MRKGCDGGEKNRGGERGKKKKRLMEIVATTSLPAVDRPNADHWNAARSRQLRMSLSRSYPLGICENFLLQIDSYFLLYIFKNEKR